MGGRIAKTGGAVALGARRVSEGMCDGSHFRLADASGFQSFRRQRLLALRAGRRAVRPFGQRAARRALAGSRRWLAALLARYRKAGVGLVFVPVTELLHRQVELVLARLVGADPPGSAGEVGVVLAAARQV